MTQRTSTSPLDPPKRADGRCAVCPNIIQVSAQARKYAGAVLDEDPFCSSSCARRYHHTELPRLKGGTNTVAGSKGYLLG